MKKEMIKKGDIIVIVDVTKCAPDYRHSSVTFNVYKFRHFNRFVGNINYPTADDICICKKFSLKEGKELNGDSRTESYTIKYEDGGEIFNTLIDLDDIIQQSEYRSRHRDPNGFSVIQSSMGIYIEDSDDVLWKEFVSKYKKKQYKKAINDLTNNVEEQFTDIDNPKHISLDVEHFSGYWSKKEKV